MKVYTKTGDGGTTSLIGGERVSKADPRVEAYGTVDELAAHLALLSDMMRKNDHLDEQAGRCPEEMNEITARLDNIQIDLMTVEAMLATGKGGEGKVAPLPSSAIARLEAQIDAMSEGLPPLAGFTIPGGHPIVSQAHVCRTVCRRAEREAIRAAAGSVSASAESTSDPIPAQYLNRLSDWLYVLGRRVVEILSIKERYWTPEKH